MPAKSNRGYLFKRKNTYYLQYDIKGKRITKSLHTSTLKNAEKERDNILKAFSSLDTQQDYINAIAKAKKIYNPRQYSLDRVVKDFETHPALKKPSEQTMKYYKNWIKNFLDWVEKNHQDITFLSAIDTEISREYSKYLYQTGISNKTFNEELNCLARVFELLKDEADIIRNPFSKDVIARLSKEAVSRKEFTKEEVNTILNSFKEMKGIPFINEYELLFYIGVYTGMRLKDACLLKWGDVNLVQKIISITPYKTKRFDTKVQIPISQWLLPMLTNAKQVYTNEYVLPNISFAYLSNRSWVHKNIGKIITYNGFSATSDNPTVQRKVSASMYTFHSLRYCFVSICAESGIPMALVQDIVGHMNPAMTKHYTRFSNEFKQKAISAFHLVESAETTLQNEIALEINKLSSDKLPIVLEYLKSLNK